ncbi:hypothetical protein HNP38_000510 [Chryseobacterium defluvii]|uniref:Uncharacterized protein n=1 Tax=Chryseobacterium defluvii TaxID=160396 RepID=A0A840KB90_9FLAO|nr:DUF6000 family protein [Chryseobacterium defluvii]MBB4805238.1 hypothetical protein [Chryseobacterium defluvii]
MESYNNEKTVQYLIDYLEYYLRKPELYFDQEQVLESVVFLDKVNGTKNKEKYLEIWNEFQLGRKEVSKINAINTAKLLEKQEGSKIADDYLKAMELTTNKTFEEDIDTEYIEQHIKILNDLKNCIADQK